jgi:hypothetical protein
MNLNEQSSNNSQATANASNEYFSMVAEKLLINNPSGKPITMIIMNLCVICIKNSIIHSHQ